MPVSLLFRGIFAATTVTVTCFVCLLTLLKSSLRLDCSTPSSGSLRPVVIACTVAAVLAIVASTLYLWKSRALSWSLAAAICSKWQPVYFAAVFVQRLILGAVVTRAVSAGGGPSGSCSEQTYAVHAVSWMWTCVTVMTALSAMGCDLNAEVSPVLRRCGYGFLALLLALDAMGSVVWGDPLAGDVSISVASIQVVLSNQLTSCITSQVVMALHFLNVSCRSRHGRGWAYAALRFELDECGRSMLFVGLPATAQSRLDSPVDSAATRVLVTPEVQPSQPAEKARANALCRLRKRWQLFQQRQMSQCRVFLIPCVEGDVGLARPAFVLRWLRPLQLFANSHPRSYIGFSFVFLFGPILLCYIFFTGQTRGFFNLVLISFLCITVLGFLSSNQYNLDRVAVKHVLHSFRFAIIASLFLISQALNIRLSYNGAMHPADVAATSLAQLLFCLFILLDCSPHLPSVVQIFISVGWSLVIGFFAFSKFQLISAGRHEDLDCFIDLGSYQVCDATQRLSIYSSLALLMTQALASRLLYPGVSNFVNASVLHSESNVDASESSGLNASADDRQSTPSVPMTPA